MFFDIWVNPKVTAFILKIYSIFHFEAWFRCSSCTDAIMEAYTSAGQEPSAGCTACTDRWQVKWKPWTNEWRNITNTDAPRQVTGLVEWFDVPRAKMLWIICHGFHSHQIATQPIPQLWEVLEQCVHHDHHQSTKCGNVLWKNGVHPSSRPRDLKSLC